MKKFLFLFTLILLIALGFGFFQHQIFAGEAVNAVAKKACLSGTFSVIRPEFRDCSSGGKMRGLTASYSDTEYGQFGLGVLIPISSDGKSFTVNTGPGSVFLDMNPKKMIYVEVDMTDGDGFTIASNGSIGALKVTGGESREFNIPRNPYMEKKYVWAQRKTSSGIEFYISIGYPIAELGSCKNENDCKNYCSKTENMIACAAYGEKRGLISKDDLAKTKEFADVLKGEGPGACKTKEACEAYCDGASHMSECVSFAEKHNLISADQLKQAKKIIKALDNGAQLPGNCTNKKSCEAYCSDSNNLDSCIAFAEKAGFMSPEELAQAKKVLPFLKSGETPGQCKTKDQCEKYCDSDSNKNECVIFAEKAGFMTKEEAELYKKTGGKGPGDCNSKESCDAYCNKSENSDACFAFAQEHDLIPADKLKEMKDGMTRLVGGLKQATPEVVSCLKQNLDDNIIGKIESGAYTPNQQAGEIIKKCFESMKTEGLAKFKEGLKQMTPEMRSCLEEKLGKDLISKVENDEEVEITPEIGTTIQSCASSITEGLKSKMEDMLKQAPLEIQSCIKEKLGNIEERAKNGEIRGPEDVQGTIQECMKDFKPAGIPTGMENYKPANIQEGDYKPASVPDVNSTPPADFEPTAEMCASFKAAPSCSYVPENVQDLCEKCKNN